MTSDLLRIALVNDYELVLAGLKAMLAPHADRVVVVETSANTTVGSDVDVVLYDTHGQDDGAVASVRSSLASQGVERVVLYTWNLDSRLVAAARAVGVDGVLSKTLPADELVNALHLIARGQRIYSPETGGPRDLAVEQRGSNDWPGRLEGLTMREAEMISLISQGLSNAEIAERTYLSPNSVKSYIRSAYRKIGVQRRSQAVAWGIDHKMLPDRARHTF